MQGKSVTTRTRNNYRGYYALFDLINVMTALGIIKHETFDNAVLEVYEALEACNEAT